MEERESLARAGRSLMTILRTAPEPLLFWALLLFQLVPVWWFPYFPSQDGPSHLENAAILRDYGRPDRGLLQTFYVLNTRPEPNWTSHLLLTGLMLLFPPLVAEKVLLSAYLLLLPLAVRYAARALHPDAGFVAVLALPFCYNVFLHMGFYNFCFGLVMFFLVLGYWLRYRGAFTPKHTAVFLVLVLLLYFCHLISLATSALVIGLLTAWRVGAELAGARRAGRLTLGVCGACLRAQVLPPLLAFLPAVVLGGHFLLRHLGDGPQTGTLYLGVASPPPVTLPGLAWGLIEAEALISYQLVEVLVSLPLGAGLLLVTGWLLVSKLRSRRLLAGDDLLLAVGVLALAYFLVPEGATNGPRLIVRLGQLAQHESLTLRLGLLIYFALLLWFAAQPFSAQARYALQAGGALATLLFLALHSSSYQRFQPYLEEFCSCRSRIEGEATVLPVCFTYTGRAEDGRPLCVRVGPFRHAVGYLAAGGGVINLLNFEAGTGYFPVLYRPEVNPYHHLPSRIWPAEGLLEETLRMDVAGYMARTGQPIDYVLLWGLQPGERPDPRAQFILQQLEGGYEPVYQSPQHGLLQMYRRKGPAGLP